MSHRGIESREHLYSLAALLQHRARDQADRTAYTFLVDGETEEAQLSYRELDRQARAIAARLAELATPGARALLLYPPGLDYLAAFFGCLYAQVIAVPVYPPRLNRPTPRLEAIVRDSQATVVLTSAEMLSHTERLFVHAPYLKPLRWLATDTLAEQPSHWEPPQVEPGQPAFLQYTSGSTSLPKGVILTHANLLANLALIQRFFDHSAQSRGVIWLPPYHDMGLIGGILQPLYANFPVVLMSPMAFLQRPMRWLAAVSRYGATTSGGPNFAYDLCVQKITPEQRHTLDLSRWTLAFNGAEPIRADTLDRFAAAFAECGFRREAFYPCYGLAEATLIVSGGKQAQPPLIAHFDGQALEEHRAVLCASNDEQARSLVSSGQAPAEQQIVIADPETGASCQPGRIGEIWVAGPSVAQGYWNQREASTQTFGARLADSGDGPFLRTGDLGVLHDGELFVTGRIKDLIILRGRNYYPQDIEQTVERCHPALRQGASAAFVVEEGDETRLVVVQELQRQQRNVDLEQVVSAMRQAVVEEHELHIHALALIKEGTIPRTSSGKIQRYACRAEYLAGTLSLVGDRSAANELRAAPAADMDAAPIRERLEMTNNPQVRRELLVEHLQRRIGQVLRNQPVTAHALLSQLGLDSLMVVEIKNQLDADLGIDLPLAQLLDDLSLDDLAQQVLDQLDDKSGIAPIAAAEPLAEYPLSHGQRALWLLHQLAPESAAYNIARAFRLLGDLDIPTLHKALHLLAERHATLRATYHSVNGEPVQRIQAESRWPLQIEDASGWSDAMLHQRLIESAYAPFDLQRGPLLRAHLLLRGPREHLLLLVVHHIAVDLWSLVILIDELRTLYPALRGGEQHPERSLSPLEIQYTDYVRWQAQLLSGNKGEQLWHYWQQQLQPQPGYELPVLNLPTDRPRPHAQSYRGAAHAFTIDAALTLAIKDLAQRNSATLFMTLLAAYQALLALYSGQNQILVGAPTAGRTHARLAPLVGYFVNPVVLRADLSDQASFVELLAQTRRAVLDALDHQAYPFPLLVERLRLSRSSRYSPLFQAALVLEKPQRLGEEGLASFVHSEISARLDLGDLLLESLPLPEETAQFDLTLSVVETGEALSATFQYNRDLFEPTTIARIAAQFQTLLARIVAQPQRSVADLSLPTSAELQQLHAWNATEQPYQRGCIHELFAAQAARDPDAVAIVAGESSLSYRELDRRANQLAHLLWALGVGSDPGREDWVAICLQRSTELVIGLLAILKVGAAYVPLDPAYPAERLGFMLDDADATVLISSSALRERLPQHNGKILYLDTDPSIASYPATAPASWVTPEHLAYVIYTSGSTGRPKGVAIAHHSVLNLVGWHLRTFALSPADRATLLAGPAFDASGWEIWPALLAGATLVIPDDETRASPEHLHAWLCEQRITISFVPTAIAEQLISAPWPQPSHLRVLLTGGDRLQRHPPAPLPFTLINNYGPTEGTVVATSGPVPAQSTATTAVPPIGSPIDNSQILILGPQGQLLPLGVAGEICLGSVGLARGYVSRPELTAERFVPHPFSVTPGARLYRTGDMGRWRTNGQIEFLGRSDQQVQVRGFRIELGEIESVLRGHPAVRETIVLARDDARGETRLVAYVVGEQRTENQEQGSTPSLLLLEDDSHSGAETLASELRGFLQSKLPSSMIPSAFVLLNQFPLTPNGKLDRRALPAPDSSQEPNTAYVAPRTETEARLAEIWCELLGIEQAGVDDNFFDRGGHSLLAAQLMSRVRKAFGVELPLSSFFVQPSIASLSATIDQRRAHSGERPAPTIPSISRRSRSIGKLADQIDQLSESEVKHLLQEKRLAKKRNSHEG